MQDSEKMIDIGSRPLPDLPPELHEVIVNHLEGDNWTLKQCALTCKLYRHFAQPLLFKSIEFRFSAYPNQASVTADRFLDILQESPQVANYVQRLALWDRYIPAGPIQKEEAIPQVLLALFNVVHLNLGRLPHFIRFTLLDTSTQLVIMKKCETLRSLTLYGVENMPLKIFDHLQRLEQLILENVLFVNNAVMQVESLRVLDVALSTNGPAMLPNDEPVFDLSKMPLLEEWALGGVVCKMGIETGPIGLEWLSRHLETISAGQKFKYITLCPVIVGAKLVTDDKLDSEGFEYFENLVVDVVLPRTESFSIQFMISDEEDESPIQEQMQKHLPTLYALNILYFHA
ncbi:hypothetical protein CPC08DRAFT_763291 [Agrocybe pediades]|nr:hypothetical protein CPC08DRAFT_763291 [Agrocybe pediades]